MSNETKPAFYHSVPAFEIEGRTITIESTNQRGRAMSEMSEGFTIYDINIDKTRPLTQADLGMLKNVYSAFGMRSEAEKALAALTLAVGQGKVSSTDAWPLLDPLIDWAKGRKT